MSKRKQIDKPVIPDPTTAVTGLMLHNIAEDVCRNIAERSGGKLLELLLAHAATGAMGLNLAIHQFYGEEDPRICPVAAAQALSSFLSTRGIASEVDTSREEIRSGAVLTFVKLKISWKGAHKA